VISLETLSQLGEFIGGFGVILTLIYLAIQLRNNTSSQRADMTARILERLSAQQHYLGFDVEANTFYMSAAADPTKLSVEERGRFLWIMYEFFGSMEFLMQQYEAGNIDEQLWLRWLHTMDYWLSFPGIKASWIGRATPFTDNFTELVEHRLTNNDFSFNVENSRRFMLTGTVSESKGLE
jgi:hypothetical protein